MSDTSHSGQESEDRRGKHWKAKIEKGEFVTPENTKAREALAAAKTKFHEIVKALSPAQRERLTALGITPEDPCWTTDCKKGRKHVSAVKSAIALKLIAAVAVLPKMKCQFDPDTSKYFHGFRKVTIPDKHRAEFSALLDVAPLPILADIHERSARYVVRNRYLQCGFKLDEDAEGNIVLTFSDDQASAYHARNDKETLRRHAKREALEKDENARAVKRAKQYDAYLRRKDAKYMKAILDKAPAQAEARPMPVAAVLGVEPLPDLVHPLFRPPRPEPSMVRAEAWPVPVANVLGVEALPNFVHAVAVTPAPRADPAPIPDEQTLIDVVLGTYRPPVAVDRMAIGYLVDPRCGL
jgi:hypothetical protein